MPRNTAENGARPRRARGRGGGARLRRARGGGGGRRSWLRGHPDRARSAEARLPGAEKSRLVPEAASCEK